ncbi:MAG: flavin reductase family protein [Pedobacter sp.]|nr:MAG: flavin reductase family protein [Pedobacter sp.]
MEISALKLTEMDDRVRATFINSLPGFKCLQLVGTISEHGHSNLGIFNSIFHLGASPALLGMVFRPGSQDHDTLANIKRTGNYTFNNVLEPFYVQAHQTSARYKSEQSEFVECGLTEFFEPEFDAPFVAESTIKIAMELRQIIPVELNATTIVIGEVKHVLLSEKLLGQDGYISHEKAGTLTTSGLDSYFDVLPIARLSYAKPDGAIKVLSNP